MRPKTLHPEHHKPCILTLRLTTKQRLRLFRLSYAQDVSIAHIIRSAIEAYLSSNQEQP